MERMLLVVGATYEERNTSKFVETVIHMVDGIALGIVSPLGK